MKIKRVSGITQYNGLVNIGIEALVEMLVEEIIKKEGLTEHIGVSYAYPGCENWDVELHTGEKTSVIKVSASSVPFSSERFGVECPIELWSLNKGETIQLVTYLQGAIARHIHVNSNDFAEIEI